jgi:16S rRNA (cytosine967-C5)-methyltransferase
MSPVEAVELLGRVGIGAAVVGVWSGCVRLEQRGDVAAALAAIPDAVVQDPAANLVSLYSDVPSGTMVADLCAAPGGKSLAVSDRPAAILAADRSESRIRMVRDNVRRTGRSMTLVVADALHPPVRQADVVLLDVPCSGTGTLARHPDARWRLEAESIGRFAELQAALLESAADVVAPGGLLVYSTCTLEAEENEERVEALLGDRSDFVVEASDAVTGDFVDGQGYLRVDPQDLGYDGSFAVRMRKVG